MSASVCLPSSDAPLSSALKRCPVMFMYMSISPLPLKGLSPTSIS